MDKVVEKKNTRELGHEVKHYTADENKDPRTVAPKKPNDNDKN